MNGVLDVSQKEAFTRKKTKRDEFEKNREFSRKISKAYRQLAKKKHWNIVDASKTKQKVHQDIMKYLSKKTPPR